jgi:DNA helicase-2/ATP-dependent DNA helicase PcrA
MVIIDDEMQGFLFSYEKLFGVKSLFDADLKNIKEGKETSLDRTRRLFYVPCSRAIKSLAIVVYTSNPAVVKNTILSNGRFEDYEIEIL